MRLTGRTEEGVIVVRSAPSAAGCFVGCGGFFAVIEGDGDCVDGFVPFVWVGGGTGRFVLDAPLCCIVGVRTGAIAIVSRHGVRVVDSCFVYAR